MQAVCQETARATCIILTAVIFGLKINLQTLLHRLSKLLWSKVISKLICQPCSIDYRPCAQITCLPQVLPALDFDGSRVDSDGCLVDSESSLVDSDDFYMGIICQFQCDAGSSRTFALLRGTGSNILLLSLILYISSSLKELSYFH